MEGGGSIRLGGRSSTRHGPTAVFSGPVRRWRKAWIPPASSSSNPSSALASRLLLYKWTTAASVPKEETVQEGRTRPLRYLPVSVATATKNKKEAAADIEGNPITQNNSQPKAQGSGPLLEDLNRVQEADVEDEVPSSSSFEKNEQPTSSQHNSLDNIPPQDQEANPDPSGIHANINTK